MPVSERKNFNHEFGGHLWTMNHRVSGDTWTHGMPEKEPSQRLAKIVRSCSDLSSKPLSECRVLDLGCLEGQHGLQLVTMGATVVGIEGRQENVDKCNFLASARGLSDKIDFLCADATKLDPKKLGSFDIVILSGLLYHIASEDQGTLLSFCAECCNDVLFIDTHISFSGTDHFSFQGATYFGHHDREHSSNDSEGLKKSRLWASLENDISFWLTRSSLINLAKHVGFSSSYEILLPAMPPRIQRELKDRCSFVFKKGKSQAIDGQTFASPDWGEGDLAFFNTQRAQKIEKRLEVRLGQVIRNLVRKVLKGN